jgi:hypothetical protein
MPVVPARRSEGRLEGSGGDPGARDARSRLHSHGSAVEHPEAREPEQGSLHLDHAGRQRLAGSEEGRREQ